MDIARKIERILTRIEELEKEIHYVISDVLDGQMTEHQAVSIIEALYEEIDELTEAIAMYESLEMVIADDGDAAGDRSDFF